MYGLRFLFNTKASSALPLFEKGESLGSGVLWVLFLLINKHRGGEREQTTEGHHNMKAFLVQPDIAKIDDRI